MVFLSPRSVVRTARLVLTLLIPGTAFAAERIADNSFLLEEAYNQERGVVQHIGTYLRVRDGLWSASFTQEWPAPSQRHQLSFTALALRVRSSTDSSTGLGDLALNYRFQAVGIEGGPVAIAPRMSVLFPTGDDSTALGSGGFGAQLNLPASVEITERVVSHVNLGTTWIRSARDPAGNRADLSSWNFGQSFVWLVKPRFNALVEFAFSTGQVVEGPDARSRFETFFVNPGIRWSHDFANGLQIVPGIAAPIGVGPSSGEQAVFLYLSFEHGFGKR